VSLLRLLSIACCTLILSAATTGTPFAWPHNPSVNVPICTREPVQGGVVMCSDGAGGAIIAFVDMNLGGPLIFQDDVYIQRVDASGSVLWTPGGVAVCTLGEDQSHIAIAPDGVGGAIVAWQDRRSGTSYDIYAQRIDASGAPQWTANGVPVSTAVGNQTTPAIVSSGGRAIVTWSDDRSGDADIYAQLVDVNGTRRWTTNGVSVCQEIGTQQDPAILGLPSFPDETIIAWEDRRGADFDLYAQRLGRTGSSTWTPNGVALCTATGNQEQIALASDGSNGVIAAWSDGRSGSPGIYARRINSVGVPLWTLDGVALGSNSSHPAVLGESVGGAVVAWEDYRTGDGDIYAQRVSDTGTPVWSPGGSAICAAPGWQQQPRIATDGTDGYLFGWNDQRSGQNNIWSQRANSSGTPLWVVDGVPVSISSAYEINGQMITDGAGGAILVWEDRRNGNVDIYAQRLEGTGRLGSTIPDIVRVQDVPDDQGGRVLVLWDATNLDSGPDFKIRSYTLWRRVVTAAAQGALEAGARLLQPGDHPVEGEGAVMRCGQGTQATYWEYIVSVPARGVDGYGYTAATTSDSMPGLIPWNVFYVDAQDASGGFYVSAQDSGYSVDNLSPAPPAPFTGAAVGASTALHWGASLEPDFAVYRLYRGSSSEFAPGPGSLVIQKPDTGYVDVGHVGSYYKLSAVDVHGSESDFTLLTPQSTLGVDGPGATGTFRLEVPAPNPTTGDCRLRFAVARPGRVSLAIFDPSGRVVRRLLDVARGAGGQVVAWDGRDAAGRRAPEGVYLARLESEGRSIAVRFAVLR